MVDTVLSLEGNDQTDYRLLRTTKNRFGSTSEIGVFSMTSTGMHDVINPSELFLSSNVYSQGLEGSAVVVTLEGTRPLLAEVQCLVGSYIPSEIKPGSKRTIEGYSIQRLLLICAVLEKLFNIKLYNRDIYVNIVGGLRINEPAADVGLAITIVSSFLNVPIINRVAFVGEVGLGGEIRSCRNIEIRCQEARNMGFNYIVTPKTKLNTINKAKTSQDAEHKGTLSEDSSGNKDSNRVFKVIECAHLRDAMNIAFDSKNVEQLIYNTKKSRNKKISRDETIKRNIDNNDTYYDDADDEGNS